MKMIHNRILNETIILRDDQEICPRCEGHGFSMKYDITEKDILRHYIQLKLYKGTSHTDIKGECPLCDGSGFVDWARRPMISDWEQEAIDEDERFRAEDEQEEFEDEYYQELDDQDNSSFNMDE